MEAKVEVQLVPSICLEQIDSTGSKGVGVQNEYSDTTFFSDIDAILTKPSKVGYELVELS